EVFFSQTCPNCPPQKEAVKEFEDEEGVKVRMTDVARNQERADNHGVRAVPTTVIDGPALDQKTGFRGVTSTDRIETAIQVARGEKDQDALETPGLLDRVKSLL
ncbi:MAG: thioredoxin family protein, partial [Candidatus Nanohaloarchaea archaeon]